MGFYSFVWFIYCFLLFFFANILSFSVAKLLDEGYKKNKKMRFGDEDQGVSIATNSSSIFQVAEEEEEDEFENVPLGKWVPSYIYWLCGLHMPKSSPGWIA